MVFIVSFIYIKAGRFHDVALQVGEAKTECGRFLGTATLGELVIINCDSTEGINRIRLEIQTQYGGDILSMNEVIVLAFPAAPGK